MSGKPSTVANALGLNGSLVIDDTSAHPGRFKAIQALEDSVANLSSGNMDNAASVPLPAGNVGQASVSVTKTG